MKRKYLFLFVPLLLALTCILYSCEEEQEGVFTVITEDFLYVSGERVIVVGRILSLGNKAVQNHGFEISTTPQFNNNITISLSDRDKPGRFIGEYAGLQLGTQYYCRAFLALESEIIYGNVLNFETLTVDITGFSPALAAAGEELIINGKNFSDNTEVFFGNRKAQIIELLFESQLKVIVPPIIDDFRVPITVKTQDQELQFDQLFEYVIGKWELVSEFSSNQQLIETISILDGDNILYGLGRVGNVINNKIWSLNLTTLSWSETVYNGAALSGAFFTSGFFGSGVDLFSPFGSTISNQVYRIQDGNFVQSVPLSLPLYKSVAFTSGDDLYVFGGSPNLRDYNYSVFRYSTASNAWQPVSVVPFVIGIENPSFSYAGKQYFVMPNSQIWQFTPPANWQQVSAYPGTNFGTEGMAVTIGDKAYIGVANQSDVWELDIPNLTWKRKTGFPATTMQRNVSAFAYNDDIYLLRRYTGPPVNPLPPLAVWKFDPDAW